METQQEFAPLPAILRPLWLACELAQEKPVYNEAEAFRLAGPLDIEGFVRALDALYERHPALRTVVVKDASGLPRVAMLPPGSFPLQQLDLRKYVSAEARQHGERAAEAAMRSMFDLATGPLVRASLIRCADDEWIFVVVLHHLIADGGSFRLLLDELGPLYLGYSPATTPGVPLRAQQLLELPASDPQRLMDLAYWRERMADVTGMEIPTDRAQPESPNRAGSRQRLPMEAGWFKRVQAAAIRLRVSPFAVVTAALSVVLARLCQTDDVVIGTTVTMRSEAEAEDMVGYFMKTVPLRLRINEQETAAEVVRQAQETVLGAIAHTSVEFDEIVPLMRPQSSPFRVALELYYEAGKLRLPDITCTRLPVHPGTAKFDFTFHLNTVPDVQSYVEYSTELYDEATARSVAGAFAALVERVCANTDCRVVELGLDDVSEDIIARWENGPELVETDLSPLPDAVRARAGLHPDQPAVVYGDEMLSFAQLMGCADLVGARLAAAGVSPKEAVGVAVCRSAAQIVAAFGVWSAGAVCAAIDPDLPEGRLRRMMRTAGIRTVLVDANTAANPAFAEMARIRADLGEQTERCPEATASRPVVTVVGDDTAYMIFTSGTSGEPKPVAIRHRSLAAFGQAMDRLIFSQLPDHSRVAVNAPFSFDASWQGTQMLRAGHTIYPVPNSVRVDSQRMVEFLRENRIEVLDGTPTHVASLVDAGLLHGTGSRLRVLVVGGEAVPVGLWRTLAAADLTGVNVYGPTEFTVNATACLIGNGAQPNIGRPLAGVRAQILDPQGRRVPIGFPGELHLSGTQLAVGYAGQPERTAERFLSGPDGSRRYASGDTVRWRGDGSLDFLGRRDGQVKLRGQRIELAEIARVLGSAPGVADAAAVVVDQGSPAAVLHAALVLTDPTTDLAAVRAFAATKLPGYMVPVSFAVLPELPRSASGKLDLAAVSGTASVAAVVPAATGIPTTPTQRRLAAIWAQLLRRKSVHEGDDFLALGGDSLLVSRLVHQVEKEFGIRLPLQTVFGNSTLSAMAKALDSKTTGVPAADNLDLVVKLASGDAGPPLVMLHPLGGSLLAYQPLLRLMPPAVPVWGVRSPTAAGGGEEHEDAASMVHTYAVEISERLRTPLVALFGWSLGGLIALAVAAELEQRGLQIGFVEIWDVGSGTEERLDDRESVRSALRAVYGAGSESQQAAVLELVPEGSVLDGRLMDAVLERTRTLGTAADLTTFQRDLQVIRHQTALFRDWQIRALRADVHVVYAAPSLRDGSVARTDWGRFTSGAWTEATVRADHYQMVRSPAVMETALGLLSRLRDQPRRSSVARLS
jgi:amino acid adenylation domain-containing protein